MSISKLALFVASFLTVQLSISQITETEPNDPFPSGNELEMGVTLTGQICMWDNPDLFILEIPEDGMLRIHTETGGEGENPFMSLSFQLFNDQNEAWSQFVPNAGEFGTMVSESFDWCCLEAGTYYIQTYTGYVYEYCYNYSISWELVPTTFANDLEPNSDYTTAIDLAYNTPTEGHLSFYGHPQGSGQDGADFYRFVAPTNGAMRVFIEAEAQSTGSNTTSVMIHHANGSPWISQSSPVGIFPNPSSDTLIWECMGNDTLFLSLYTTNYFDRGYSYRVRYDIVSAIYDNDVEDNNTIETAQEVDASIPIEGNQFFFGDGSQDFFKFEKPELGDMKIVMRSETYTGDATAGHSLQLYAGNFSQIGGQFTAPLGIYNVPAVDSITYGNLPAGTYYLQSTSNYAYAACRSYQLTISFDNYIGISTNSSLSDIKVYPNPSSGTFFIEGSAKDDYDVEVYSSTGVLIEKRSMSHALLSEFDFKDFAKGVYLIRISSGKAEVSHRLLIQ
jgi:hypothetical protein